MYRDPLTGPIMISFKHCQIVQHSYQAVKAIIVWFARNVIFLHQWINQHWFSGVFVLIKYKQVTGTVQQHVLNNCW